MKKTLWGRSWAEAGQDDQRDVPKNEKKNCTFNFIFYLMSRGNAQIYRLEIFKLMFKVENIEFQHINIDISYFSFLFLANIFR